MKNTFSSNLILFFGESFDKNESERIPEPDSVLLLTGEPLELFRRNYYILLPGPKYCGDEFFFI